MNFRFADARDKVYIFLAVLCSIISGMGFPFAAIIFSETAYPLMNALKLDQLLNSIPEVLKQNNLTRMDILGNPSIFKDQCNNLLDDFGFNCTMDNSILNKTCDEINFDNSFSEALSIYIYRFILCGACVFIASIGQVTFWTVASERQANRIRRELLTNILRQDIGWFDTHEAAQVNTKLSAEISLIQNGIGDKAGTVVQYMTTFVAGYIFGFHECWKLALVLVALSPAMVLAGILFSYVSIKMSSKAQDAYSKAGIVAEEILSSIRTVIAFGGEEKGSLKYDRNLSDAHRYGLKKGMANGGAIGFYSLVNFSTYALGMWYGGQLVRDGEINVREVIVVFFSVSLGTFSLGIAAPGIQAISEARGAAYNIFKLIDMKSKIDSSSEEGLRPDTVTGDLSFQNIQFAYPSRMETKVINDVSIDVRPGQAVALVGQSGCGKTTLVQLLLRFYDPHQGQILLDGHNVKDLNVKWLRQHIGFVSQEPVLFDTTIAENIRYGQEGVSQEQINEAAKKANAYDFISKLPDKFLTIVGEKGAQLSGGQKQRIAIARALVRDPKILLLDEATSALDTESESMVQDALDKARQGRTTIVIAHRLSTIRSADIIIALDQGQVKEKGTHDELMANRGIYYTLVMNQSKAEEEDALSDGDEKSKDEKHGRIRLLSTTAEDEKESKIGEDSPDAAFLELLLMNSPEWPFLLLGSIAAIAHGSSQPMFAYVFSSIVSAFSQDGMKMMDDLEKFCLMLFVISICSFLSSFLQGWMLAIAGEAMTRRLRSNAFKSMLRQEIAWHDKPFNSTGALTSRLAKDASLVQGATGTRMGIIIQCFVAMGGAITLSLIFGWQLTLVAVSFFPFLLFGGVVQMQLIGGNVGLAKEAIENSGKIVVEALENVRTVASLSMEESFISMYMYFFDDMVRDLHKRALILGVIYAFSNAMVFFSICCIFAYGSYLVDNDVMNPYDVLKVFTCVVFCGVYLGQSAAFGPDVGQAKAAARRMLYILKRQSEINASLPLGEKPNKSVFQSTVEFHATKFSYPLRPDVKVLQGLSFRVEPGQTVALVGSSGCGKSTCISLLERFYDAGAGHVTVGNHKLEDLNIRWLRSHIGLVSQEPVLFDCSIAENIAYGDNSRDVSMEEIVKAAKEANIHNFVSALPLGYDTNVGEKGTQLSGGQKQRIAIARALVRDPKILLLDEAMSALDTGNEKIVQEALDKAREGRTCITIAHRQSTIQDACKIVVIHQGEALEQGTHDELMACKEAYYRLQNAQKKGRELHQKQSQQ